MRVAQNTLLYSGRAFLCRESRCFKIARCVLGKNTNRGMRDVSGGDRYGDTGSARRSTRRVAGRSSRAPPRSCPEQRRKVRKINKLRSGRGATKHMKQILWCPPKDKATTDALREDPSLVYKKKDCLQRHDQQCGDLQSMLAGTKNANDSGKSSRSITSETNAYRYAGASPLRAAP